MLEKLKIENFQTHQKRLIEFDPGVTTIIGQTDSGKSSIIRALRWLTMNQPAGDAFIRDGAKGVSVRLMVDGRTIKRLRGGSRNEYSLDDQQYRAFGADVPDSVADVLRLSEINFSGQLDPPFWFCETPGEVSRRLNAIVDLKIIDDALAAVAAAVRRAQARREVSEEREQAAIGRAKELEWVPAAVAAFERVQAIEARKAAKSGRVSLLRRLVAEFGEYASRAGRAATAAATGEATVLRAKRLRDRAAKKESLIAGMAAVARLKVLATAPPDMDGVEECKCEHEKALVRCLQLRYAMDDIVDGRLLVERLDGQRLESEQELTEKMDGQCPVCGGDIE